MTKDDLVDRVIREFSSSHSHADISYGSLRELARVATETVSRVGACHGSRMNSHRLSHAARRAAKSDARCGSILSTIALWALSQLVQYLLHLWLRDGAETRCMMSLATGLPAWSADDDGAVTQMECAAMVAGRDGNSDLIGA